MRKPIIALAPMANVTDPAFRRLIAKHGKPDVMFTEFVSADGLCNEEARAKLLKDLIYDKRERPIIVQIFSGNPEKIHGAAKLAQELNFDGIDINMGCPDRAVEKSGAGAALIKNPQQAQKIIRAAREGAPRLPISVKTRLGYNKDELETWLPALLAETPAAITIHARTRKEMSKVPARWERIKRAVEIRNILGSDTLILGNGDIKNLDEARKKVSETGADGVMIGRAIFGNPTLFAKPKIKSKTAVNGDFKNKLRLLTKHIKLFDELCSHKNFAIMKKHFKAYAQGFAGAKELRVKLMACQNSEEAIELINNFLAD